MQNQFSRTQMLLGSEAMNTLVNSRVAIFGIGGVGGYVAEVLARCGVGALDLIDSDRVSLTNVNRQVIALLSNIGRYKVDVAEERIHDINPQCVVRKHRMFFLPENAEEIDLAAYDYVVDCIDTMVAKIELVKRCHTLSVPLLCCMGAANKMDATAFQVTDIKKTKMDPLAKVMRKKLKELHIGKLKCVWSDEPPLKPFDAEQPDGEHRRSIPASNAFVPAAEGIIAGGEVVKDLLRKANALRI